MFVVIVLLVGTIMVQESFGREDGEEQKPIVESVPPETVPMETEIEVETLLEPQSQVCLDITPPKGKAKELVTWWDEEPLTPEEFVETMEDDTEITVTFQTMPDMAILGEEQEIKICLTDQGNNQTILESKLILLHDGEAPQMTGVFNITIFAGDTISYRKNVKVIDNHDENPKLVIDSSQVNRNKVGTYYVTYHAEDKAGNITEKTIFVKVMEKLAVTQEMVDALADQVLAEILSDTMSNWDKAYAIYKWTKQNIAYTGHTDPSDIVAGAYQGLRYRAGDCFTFCAVAHMLYLRAGFEALKVTRTAGYLHHYWNYVNIGAGWFHCDSNLYRTDYEVFMKTTEEVVEYSTTVMNRPDYYIYDENLYPPCGSSLEEIETVSQEAEDGVDLEEGQETEGDKLEESQETREESGLG